MSWFPSFLNLKAAGLAAIFAPLGLLVLYFLKLRRREMAVSSTLLWKKAIQDLQVNAPFQKLRKNLLLLLQLLLLFLLIFALARPVSRLSQRAGKMTVILIDRSASMGSIDMEGNASRLTDAKRRAKDLVDTMKRDDVATLIAFDDTAETVVPFTTDTARLKTAIDRIEQTDRGSRLKLAYQLADAQMNFNADQNRSIIEKPAVFLYSDGRVLDADSLILRGELHYVREGTDTAGNVGVVALSAKRNYENPNEVQVFARLTDYGPEPVEADVELKIDGEPNTSRTTMLLPDRWDEKDRAAYEADPKHVRPADSVEFKVDLTGGATIQVEQMLKLGDVLAADDTARVVVPPPRTLSVLLVTDGNYFLERAIDSLNLKHPDKLLPMSYEKERPTKYDVILFDRYQPKYMPSSGNFIFFGAVPDGIKLKAIKENNKNVLIKDTTVLDWKRDHPTLRHLSLNKLYIGEALKLDVPSGADILVQGFKGPLVVLDHEGGSQYVVVGFDVLQSNWPLKMSFPIFIHNVLQYLTLGADMNVREAFAPGATPSIPRPDLQKIGDIPKTLTLTGPDGSKRSVIVPESGDVVLPALNRVGTYSLDPAVPHYEKFAVNLLDTNESNTWPVVNAPGFIGTEEVHANGRARAELWWWLVAAGLGMLMVEWWVYTRRVHI